jgi:hypothetical protein
MSDDPRPPDDRDEANDDHLDPADGEPDVDPEEFLPPEEGAGGPPPEGKPEKGRVLSPNDLDISDQEEVEEIEEGRYVVSAGDGPPNVPDDPGHSRGAEPGRQGREHSERQGGNRQGGGRAPGAPGAGGGMQSPEAARNLLDEELGRTRSRYGIDVVGRFDGEPARHRTVSDDVVATFENLVLWYARQLSDETPTEEVIEILLREASVVPDPGTPNLKELLAKHDLTPHDSIAELVAAITQESGD